VFSIKDEIPGFGLSLRLSSLNILEVQDTFCVRVESAEIERMTDRVKTLYHFILTLKG